MKLEEKLKEFIEEYYECEFTGKLKIRELPDSTYNLDLYTSCPDIPINMTYQGEFSDFVKFVIKQIKERRLTDVKYFKGIRYEQGRNC